MVKNTLNATVRNKIRLDGDCLKKIKGGKCHFSNLGGKLSRNRKGFITLTTITITYFHYNSKVHYAKRIILR